MSHSNELDNGVTVIANGGDLSGEVIFVLPDGRRIETTWDKTIAAPEMYTFLEQLADEFQVVSCSDSARTGEWFDKRITRIEKKLAAARGES